MGCCPDPPVKQLYGIMSDKIRDKRRIKRLVTTWKGVPYNWRFSRPEGVVRVMTVYNHGGRRGVCVSIGGAPLEVCPTMVPGHGE